MKKSILRITAIILVLLLAGCTAQTKSSSAHEEAYSFGYEYSDSAAVMNSAEQTAELRAAASGTAVSVSSDSSGSGLQVPEGRKWIINMYVSAECADLDTALADISFRTAELGGYIESQNISNGSSSYSRQRRSASMTLRIPAESADAFMQEVSGMTNVTSSSRNVADITLAYTDTAGRISALEAEEARLLELMSKAENMTDLLAIESRLTEVRYELESYTSTLRVYDNQVDYATISLNLTQVTVYTPVEEPGFGERIISGLKTSLEDLGQSLIDTAAWLIIDIPYLLIWLSAGWVCFLLIRRRLRRWKAKKAAGGNAQK